MGSKKHKKHHKSDRRERFHEIVDKAPEPQSLRLVLKVGGSSASEHGDSPHVQPHPEVYVDDRGFRGPEKHKKSKKKKKKKSSDREKHEKKHKHHHHHHYDKKERKKREREDSTLEEEVDDIGDGPAIKRPLISVGVGPAVDDDSTSERPFREPRACTLKNRQSKSALQRLLDNILKGLERKDPQQFFAWPVTDHIAPGYSSIIQHPMDFSTMRQKIDNNEYPSVNDFKNDFKLMCDNATTYNRADTIYYKSAKRLLHIGFKMMSKEKLTLLCNTLPFVAELGVEELGFELQKKIVLKELVDKSPEQAEILPEEEEEEDVKEFVPIVIKEPIVPVKPPKPPKPSKFECFPDDISPEEILAQAQKAANDAAARLTLRKPKTNFGFLRQGNDGSTSLTILTPNRKDNEQKAVTLEMVVGKLTQGTGSLNTYKEEKKHPVRPVSYMNYGSYSSYAPNYDSMFSNLTKEESDLLFSTYGDEAGVQYAESILNFAKDCDYVTGMVDNLLDILTDGEHSKAMRVLEEKEAAAYAAVSATNNSNPPTNNANVQQPNTSNNLDMRHSLSDVIDADMDVDFGSLRSLADIGIDVSFLDSMEVSDVAEKEVRIVKPASGDEKVQKKLDETTGLLQDLERVQVNRLSAKLPSHLSQLSCPSKEETDIAEKVTENLKEITKQVTPADITSVLALRKAMGITTDPTFGPDSVQPGGTRTPDGEHRLSPRIDDGVSRVGVADPISSRLHSGVREMISSEDVTSECEMPELSAEVEGVADLESEIQKFLEGQVVSDLPPQLEPSGIDGIL